MPVEFKNLPQQDNEFAKMSEMPPEEIAKIARKLYPKFSNDLVEKIKANPNLKDKEELLEYAKNVGRNLAGWIIPAFDYVMLEILSNYYTGHIKQLAPDKRNDEFSYNVISPRNKKIFPHGRKDIESAFELFINLWREWFISIYSSNGKKDYNVYMEELDKLYPIIKSDPKLKKEFYDLIAYWIAFYTLASDSLSVRVKIDVKELKDVEKLIKSELKELEISIRENPKFWRKE